MAENRVSQEAIEVLNLPSADNNEALSQLAVEVLNLPSAANNLAVSQVAVEILLPARNNAHVVQAAIDFPDYTP